MAAHDRHIRSPFKFLDPYDRKDGDSFFGRDEEVETLYQYVNKNRLVLLYGQSGTGKTSVVQCGLANRFEITDWLPFFVRRGKDINRSLRGALSQSKALGGMAVEEDNLLQAIDRISARYVRPVYLIFDQFEELLILGEEEEKKTFIRTIKSILDSEQTQSCNFLFILREEYFAGLDVLEREIPGFSDRRMRIEAMRPPRLEQVILQSCETFNIRLEKGAESAGQMLGGLRTKGGIPLPYLQVYLDMFWREDFARTYPQGWEGKGFPPLEFTEKEIEAFGDIKDVLEGFLEERTQAIQAELAGDFPKIEPNTVTSVLDAFATDEGTKRPVPYQRADEQVRIGENAPAYLRGLPPPLLTACLDALEQSRLLRTDEDSYELAHDTLAALIEQKRTDEQRHLSDLRRQIESSYRVYQQTGDMLTRKQLIAYEDYIEELDLRKEMLVFIKDSRQFRDEEESRELKAARRRSRLAAGFTVLALLLALFAGWNYVQAQRNAVVAEENLEKAEVERGNAEQALETASQALVQVEIERDSTKEQRRIADENARVAQEKTREAEKTLSNLKAANTDVVRLILQNAERDVLKLDYEAALEKTKAAGSLNALEKEVVAVYLEIAFWQGEAGNVQRAANLLDSAFLLVDRKPEFSGRPDLSRENLRDAIRQYDTDVFEFLWERYYPVMVEVEGGPLVSDFKIAKYETTWWQYYLFCEATGHEYKSPGWGRDGDNPAVHVSWLDAVEYSNWVSGQFGLDEAISKGSDGAYTVDLRSEGFRLPTETEWEYAAREGKRQSAYEYSGSDDVDSVAWYSKNSGSRTHPVGKLKPNALGLYDMSGNVWEWCWNWYERSPGNPLKDYSGPDSGSSRVLRGGSLYYDTEYCRVSYRNDDNPRLGYSSVGFRLAQD